MKQFTFGKQDLISLAKGLGITALGAVLTYLASWITKTDFGVYTPIIVTVGALLVNMARKSLDGIKE